MIFSKIKFRQKILLSQVLLFSCFILLSLPFVERGIFKLQINAIHSSASDLISSLIQAKTQEGMVATLNKAEGDVFYKIILYSADLNPLVSTYRSNLDNDTEFSKQSRQAAEKALLSGKKGKLFDQMVNSRKYILVSSAFSSQDQVYVLQGVFPYQAIFNFSMILNIWFAAICIFTLILFSVFSWIIFIRLHRPINQIIKSILAYREGKKDLMTDILVNSDFSKDEDLGPLAETLLSLHTQVQSQLIDLTDAKNEKEAILESLVEGVIATDANMIVNYVNFAGANMLCASKKDLIGKSFADCSHAEHEELYIRCLELLKAARIHKTVISDSIALDMGKKVYYDLVAAPKSNLKGAILVLQDKSSKHKVLEMGKDFVANASHELRTPITIIKGFTETLQDMRDMPHDMLTTIIEKIVRNCERMECLIKNLLTLADIENLSISPHQVSDLVTLIENCIEMVKAVYTDAFIYFEKSHYQVMANADANILELAIINLLTNAAKYSKPPANIKVVLTIEGDAAKIKVSDKGIGIPLSDIEHIFDRFFTVDKAHSRKLGGAGLGLSLVKTIIEKHHGKIFVESELGIGSTFTLFLPLARTI
ncbi:MAG: PAS domain-containing protein [Chlamydiae bacterium]|nr:PAS domain-containing protein [Chlamydiota bacterium]